MTMALIPTLRGRFITMEGGEGVGKTTNRNYVAAWLRQRGITLRETREPGGTPLGESLRRMLLSTNQEAPSAMAELLMIFAARAQHLAEVIEPALEAGEWVLCDRFTDATFAYQGAGRGLSIEAITALEALTQQSVRPDLVLLLDVDPRIGMQRAVERGNLDRFEREDIAFFDRVRAGYLERALACPERYRVIDAGQSITQVAEQLDSVLQSFVGEGDCD